MDNRSVPMVQNQNSILEIKLVRLELIESNLIPRSFSSCLQIWLPLVLECAAMQVPNLFFSSVFHDCYVEIRRVLSCSI